MATVDDASSRARAAAQSPWLGRAGRFGLAAQGVSYAIVAVLALMLAFDWGGKTAGRPSALQTLADETLGGLLLVLVAAGFASYAAWRFARAFFDRDHEGDRPKGLAKRAGDLGKGLLYAGLAVSVVRILFGADERGEERADKTTAGVLGWPAGRWLVFAVAAAIGIAAIWNVYRGLSRKFEDDLELGKMTRGVRRLVARLGLVGLVSRGVVFGVIAWFLTKAAYDYEPREAVGLGGALAKLASATYGDALLAAVAAGLLAFALFSLAQSRYRDV
jgi:uncharacterized membrane protein YidH (DUF202 family)